MKYILFIPLIILFITGTSYSQNGYGSELAGAVAVPIGDNAEFFNVGYGAIGGFYYEMESNWRFGLTLGFIRFNVNSSEVNNYFQTLGQPGTVDLDGSVSTIPILLTFKYMFPGEATRFYGIIEGGLYTYWSKAEGTINYSDGSTAPLDKSEFSSEIGWAAGFGALFPVSEEVSVDANVRYHFVKSSETINVNYYTGEQTVGSSHFLTVAVGANWNFNL
jgi:outer membrane protein W